MARPYDVFGMCNALFDLQAEVPDEQLLHLGLSKGAMMLISEEQQRAIVPKIYSGIVNTEPGGSGANTMIGLAQLGSKAIFTSRVGKDEHGRLYRTGLEKLGVKANLGEADGETGISLILVSPDAQRTMLTFLGQARDLRPEDVNVADIAASKYIYVTGYLWDTDNQKEAVLHAMKEANKAGTKVSFSLSDPFCVERHKDAFLNLLDQHIDVVFANRKEASHLVDEIDPVSAARKLAKITKGLAVVTKDADGSLLAQGDEVVEIPVHKVKPVDTTGAGDMFAAGVLHGLAQGMSLADSGRVAAYMAGNVVAKLGPRLPSVDREQVFAEAKKL